MVMALFDLYGFLVEGVIGGLFTTLIVMGLVFLLIMLFGKLNGLTIMSVLVFYLMVCGIFYSAITFFLILILDLFYFSSALIRWFSGGLN